jgi:cytochrome b561
MSLRNTATTYGSITRKLHILVFILITVMLSVGWLMGEISDKPLRGMVVNIHKLLGLFTLAVGLLMLFWGLVNTKPLFPATMSRWEKSLARLTQGCLYLLIIAMPLSGWIMSSAAGRYPDLFGIPLAMPAIPQDKSIAGIANELHEILAWCLIGFITLHLLGAIKHYFISCDKIVQRMFGKTK